MEATAITTLLTSVGSVFTTALSWIGDMFGVIMENPLALVLLCVPLIVAVIAFVRNLVNI